jgi:hypothetical protein
MSAITDREQQEARDGLRENAEMQNVTREFFGIEDVPRSIPHDAYMALIKSLGLNPDTLKRLEFHMDGVYALVMAKDAKGHLVIDHAANEIRTHKLFIPVSKP